MINKRCTALIASGLIVLASSPLTACTMESAAADESQSSATEQTATMGDTNSAPAPRMKAMKASAKVKEDSTMDDSSPDPLAQIREFITSKKIDKSKSNWRTRLSKPPKLQFEKEQVVHWTLETSEGDIVVNLRHDVAPMHASSTIYLAELGFYDDLIFHRVIKNFMAQGGCPLGTGTGSPGYKYAGEFSKELRHDRPGLLSMANSGPNTDGSQFFLTFVPTPHLDGKHTIFGEVVEGMDVIKTLEKFGSQSGSTSKRLVITKTSITIK